MNPSEMIKLLESGSAWARIPMSEQLAMRAMARQLTAMAERGVTREDWQQLAGYAEWATTSVKPQMRAEPAISGQWIQWEGGGQPVTNETQVSVVLRNGYKTCSRAGGLRWVHAGEAGDIVRYCVVD